MKFMHLTTISSKKLLDISYLISKRIAFVTEAYTCTIADNVIKSCILKAVKIFLSKNNYRKLKSIPLSDNTVSHRIDDMGMNIKSEVYFC